MAERSSAAARQRVNGSGNSRLPPVSPTPLALDPARQIIKLARSAAPGNVPTGLEEGELGIDLAAPPRLWVGCPLTIDASGLLQLHVADPAGSYLPLSGGTLSGPGNLTLDGGTLTVSGASPAVTWDRTGIDPTQWTMYASSLQWRIEEGTTRLFQFDRNDATTPPIYECQFLETVRMAKFLAVNGPMQAIGGLTAWGVLQSDGQAVFNGDTYICNVLHVTDNKSPGVPPLVNFYPDSPVTGPQTLGAIRSSGLPGVFNATDPGFRNANVVGALIRFGATQEWERDIVGTWPTATSDVLQLGAQIEFFVSENNGPSTYRAMTLEQDGTLAISGAYPGVALDVTSGLFGPMRWRIEAEDEWCGVEENGNYPFWLERVLRSTGFPTTYGMFLADASLIVDGHLTAGYSRLQAIQTNSIYVLGGPFAGHIDFAHGVDVGSQVVLTMPTPVTGAGQTLGDVWAYGAAGIDTTTPSSGHDITTGGRIAGAGIRFLSTRGWQRDTTVDPGDPPTIPSSIISRVDQLGSEIAFFVSANGAPTTYRAMTLQQDGNLSLPFGFHFPTTVAGNPESITVSPNGGWLDFHNSYDGPGEPTGIRFKAGPDIVLTAEPGILRFKGDSPAMIWDVTGAVPAQWALRFEASGDWWGMEESGNWPFWISRNTAVTPFQYDWVFDSGVIIRNGHFLGVDGPATVNQHLNANGGVTTTNIRASGDAEIESGAWIGQHLYIYSTSTPTTSPARMQFTEYTPVTGWTTLGELWAGGPPGIDNTPLTSITSPGRIFHAAGIRFNATQGWRRDATVDPGVNPPDTETITSDVIQLGSEITFWVTPNGQPNAYQAMTLENDGSLTVVGTVTASGSLLTSDPDLKDDIAQAPSGALAKVCELPVIDFRWKHGRDSKTHRGFSADDVMRVMGEDSGCSAEGAYSLADMNAVLWQSVQELAAEVQELKERMNGTKSRRPH